MMTLTAEDGMVGTSIGPGFQWLLNRVSRALSDCIKNVFVLNVNSITREHSAELRKLPLAP